MALSSNMDMGIRGTGSSANCDEELKTQFMYEFIRLFHRSRIPNVRIFLTNTYTAWQVSFCDK